MVAKKFKQQSAKDTSGLKVAGHLIRLLLKDEKHKVPFLGRFHGQDK